MYSQCPECLTRFRVTAAALRAAHGTVRCGRCGSAFDALPRLTDALLDEQDMGGVAPVPTAAASLAGPGRLSAEDDRQSVEDDGTVITEFHFSADDIEQVFVDADDWQRQFGEERLPEAGRPDDVDDASRADDNRVAAIAPDTKRPVTPADVYVHEPEAVEDITLEGERIVIEGLSELDDDLRESGGLIDELHDGGPDAVPLDDASTASTSQPAIGVDLDSTDRFDMRRHTADSMYPVLERDGIVTTAADLDPGHHHPVDGAVTGRPEVVDVIAASAAAEDLPAASIEPGQPASAVTARAEPGTAEPATPRDAAASPAVAATTPPPAPPIVPFRLRDRSRAFDDALAGDDAEASDDDDGDADVARGRGATLAWAIGALLLALGLVAQLAHHYRQDLARDATLGPVLRAVYARLGRPLEPNWDLSAFELRQWGSGDAAPTSSGLMTVRASLRNGADFPQPLPLLRLELEDRFGGTVARRDFAAAEYLKDPAQASRLLRAGDQTEAELVLVDVGTDAVGYRLDVCLREDPRSVRCAQHSAPGGGAPR